MGCGPQREAAAKLGCSIKTLKGHVDCRAAALRDRRSRQQAPAPHVHRRRSRRVHCQSNPQGRPMSVYRKPRSPYWHFDFQWRGHRFHGSTKTANRREARKGRGRRAREGQATRRTDSRRRGHRCGSQDVATRYWTEIGAALWPQPDAWQQLGLLITFFGQDKLADRHRQRRRGENWWRGGAASPERAHGGLTLAVHRQCHRSKQLKQTIHPRQALGRALRARADIGASTLLTEPQERVRELVGDEARAIRSRDARRLCSRSSASRKRPGCG